MDDTGGNLPPVFSRENSPEKSKRRKRRTVNAEHDKGKSTQKEDTTIDVDSVNVNSNVVDTCKDLQQYHYDKDHMGPYIVYIDSYDDSGMSKYLNGVTVSRLLIKLGVAGIREVVKIGFGRCKVICNSYEAANFLAENTRLLEHGLSPKMFAHFVSKVGIVFDIPSELSEDEFMESVQSPIEILRCIRSSRRSKNTNGDEKKEPSRSIKLIFKGSSIPNDITLGYIKIPVRHFISFAQCYKCFRFNHFALHCKQNYELCRDYFNQHTRENPCGVISCVNCKGDHAPTFRNCPARSKAFAIRKLMTIENLSAKEARTRFANIFSNRFSVLSDYEGDFPPLRSVQSKPNVINNHQEAVKDLYNILPFSKVVKNNSNKLREEAKARETMQAHQKILREHEVKLPYNRSSFSSQTGVGTSPAEKVNLLVNGGRNNQMKAMEVFSQISKQTTEMLINITKDSVDIDKLKSFLNNVRENVNVSWNYLDVDRINSASSSINQN